MSNNNHEELRLLSLVAAIKSIAEPALTLEQVLDLALKKEVRLYAKLPPGIVTHVNSSLSIVMLGAEMSYQISEAVALNYSFNSPHIHPEVTHVVLDPLEAETFKVWKATTAKAFISGLKSHPDSSLAKIGWLVPCQFDGPLVTCPTSPRTETEKRRGRTRSNVIEVTLDDIQVNERLLDLLDGSLRSLSDVPHFLRERTYGVYVLYCAAKQHHAALKAKTIDIKEVESEVLKRLSSLGATRVAHVVKLIRPGHRRNSGIATDNQVEFGADVLHRPNFRRKYLEVDFMTEALALVLYVAERWHEAHGGRPSNTERLQLEAHFREVGFYQKESEALASLTIWPVQ